MAPPPPPPLPPPGEEYAECPDCLHDGPHVMQGYSILECSNCYHEFHNPHV